MSVYFRYLGREIWNPASSVGVLFYDQLRALERMILQDCGVIATLPDEYYVEPQPFERFVVFVLGYLARHPNRTFAVLVAGCCEIALALLARINGTWPEVSPGARAILDQAQTVMAPLYVDDPIPLPPIDLWRSAGDAP